MSHIQRYTPIGSFVRPVQGGGLPAHPAVAEVSRLARDAGGRAIALVVAAEDQENVPAWVVLEADTGTALRRHNVQFRITIRLSYKKGVRKSVQRLKLGRSHVCWALAM